MLSRDSDSPGRDRPLIQGFRLMRIIDHYLGPPCCIALAAVRSLARQLRRTDVEKPRATIKKVLVIKFWGMGSIVLATPALRALKRAHPDCELTFLTFEHNEIVCRMIRSIDRVHTYRASSATSFVASFFHLVRFLRRERFDTVIDLEFFANFTSIITALSAAPLTVGFHTPKVWRERYYSERVSFDQSRHISEIFLKAIQALGVEADGRHLEPLGLNDDSAAPRLAELLSSKGVTADDRLICMNVNASSLDYKRRWPLESFAALIAKIIDEGDDIKVVLIGAADEIAYVQRLMDSLPASAAVINLCGLVRLDQLVLLLQQSALFIGNDSGPLHLAVAAGLPTVSFFGPESPALYAPRGASHTVLYKNIPCSPCLNVLSSKDNSSCRNNICMKTISLDEAWDAVSQQLAQIRRAPAQRAAGGTQ